jgi:hypothetical protein
MAALLSNLSREHHGTSRLCYTRPHPCAVIMRQYFAGDDWGERIQDWAFARYELEEREDELKRWRETRDPPSDAVEALALDRRAALRYLSVYRDVDMKSLWYRSAFCACCRTPERKRKWGATFPSELLEQP